MRNRTHIDRSRGEIRKLRNDCLRSQEEVAAMLSLTRAELQTSESRALLKFKRALFHLLGREPVDTSEAILALLEQPMNRIPLSQKRKNNVRK